MKKILACALALTMVMASFAGCSSSNTTSSAAPEGSQAEASSSEAASSEPVTITHWYWADSNDYSASMQEMAADFNATNDKGITVVAEEYPWDGGAYSETLFTAVMGGGGPDTSAFKLTSTPLFTANNLLANLDEYINGWDMKDDIDGNIYDIIRQAANSESLYVMPWNVQVLYMYYRPSIYEQAGITEIPTTYEDLLTAIEKCTLDTNGDGKTDIYGFGMRGSNGGQEPWGCFMTAYGATFDDMTTPEAVHGMQDYIDIFQKGYAPPTAPQDGFNEIIANFKSGKTAMTIHHIGSSAGMVETFGDDVDAFAFPGTWCPLGDTENVIFEGSKNKDAAFEWVSYLAVGDGQEKWCSITGNMPVSKTVQAMPEFQENKFMVASINGQSIAGIIPILDTTTEWISTIWPNTVAAALSGQMTAEEACATLQKGLHG